MTSPNGLICFTNCLLSLEDGSLVEQDLWIDEQRGIVLNAQVHYNSIPCVDRIEEYFRIVTGDFLLEKGEAREDH